MFKYCHSYSIFYSARRGTVYKTFATEGGYLFNSAKTARSPCSR